MGAFEYLLLFAAVILGLAISDLAISLHLLLNAGKKVKWGRSAAPGCRPGF